LQKKIVAQRMKTLIGTTDTALLLRQTKPGTWLARLPRQAPEVDGETRVTGAALKAAKPGGFVSVEITGCKDYDLTARA